MTHLPAPSELAGHWRLDPEVVFLNHGSYGATPRVVLEAQDALRARMEAEPVRFFGRELEGLLDQGRAEVGRLVNADADDLAFVPNATAGVNAILRSISLSPGDELLTTDHAYNACKNVLDFVAGRAKAKVVVARVPFPIRGPEEVVDAIEAAVSARTRLVMVDHVTSPTALIFPVAEIAKRMRARGVLTLVDGAHGPGMLPVDLEAIDADYYTGNFHKWVCAPKGAAFLWVRRELQEGVVPTLISHGLNATRTDRSKFRLLFDWMGTDDPTPFLCVPAALRFLGGLAPGGLSEVMQRNHALVLRGRDALCRALGVRPPAPDAMLGSIASVVLPKSHDSGIDLRGEDRMQRVLADAHQVRVPVFPWPTTEHRLLRISAQLYNADAQYTYLAEKVRHELGREPTA